MSTGCVCKKDNAVTKLGYSAIVGALFFVLALPFTFQQLSKLFGRSHVYIGENGVPTVTGVIIHAVIFTLIVFLIMQPWKKQQICNNKC